MKLEYARVVLTGRTHIGPTFGHISCVSKPSCGSYQPREQF